MSLIENKSSQKGIGLVETIVALGLGVVVLTALVSLSVFTLRTSTRGKLMLEGSKRANEQLELVRAYRDLEHTRGTTWDTFVDGIRDCTDSNPCSMSVDASNEITFSSSALEIGVPTDPTYMNISFYVTDPATGGAISGGSGETIVRINVEILWNVGAGTQSSFIYSDISNWRFQ